jgi:hypothetical protein
MHGARWLLVAGLSLATAHCGSGLDELPLDAGHITRNLILLEAASSRTDAYLLYHTGGSAPATLAHWDGSTITDIAIDPMAQITSMANLGANHVALGGVAVLDVNGTSVNDITNQTSGAARFMVAGNGNGYLYAVAMTVTLRRTPGATTFDMLAAPPGGFTEVIMAETDRLVIVGNGDGDMPNAMYFFDGTAWNAPTLSRTGRNIAAAAFNDVWAMPLPTASGTPLSAESWDGSSWTDVPITVPAQARNGDNGTLSVLGVIPLGNYRAGAVVTRSYSTMPPYREILWVTGNRVGGLSNSTSVRVYCTQTMCSDGGDFTGGPVLAADGTLFVGPYYGHVSR